MNYDRQSAQLMAKLTERREYLASEIKYILSVNTQVKDVAGLTVTNHYAAGKMYAHQNEIDFINSIAPNHDQH